MIASGIVTGIAVPASCTYIASSPSTSKIFGVTGNRPRVLLTLGFQPAADFQESSQ